MRWKEPEHKTTTGARRDVSEFLFFPKCINGEWRWLEWATIEQVFIRGAMDPYRHYAWLNERWIDEGSQS